MTSQTHNMHWEGIDIEVKYTPQDFNNMIAHLEIHSISPPRAPLPMTETGYRSHYHSVGIIESEANGDVVAFVTAWLDEKAKGKKWIEYQKVNIQMELF